MNFLGILSLLLISSSSVLCRRIQRQDVEHTAQKELSDLPKLREEPVENATPNSEMGSVNSTTPRDETTQRNAPVPAKPESPGVNLSGEYQGKLESPISKWRIQEMLKEAIMKIITGELSNSDMLLLKSLNYDAEQVRIIRERELGKRQNQPKVIRGKPTREHERKKKYPARKSGFDYEAFNNQATYDYEYAATNFESRNASWNDSFSEYDDRIKSSTETFPDNRRSLGPNVVFTISYNDSQLHSNSEKNRRLSREGNSPSTFNGTGNNFPAAVTSANSSPAPVDDQIDTLSELWNITRNYFSTTDEPVEDNDVSSQNIPSGKRNEDLNSAQLPDGHFRYENVEEPSRGEENRSRVSLIVAALSSTTEIPTTTNNSTSGRNHTVISTKYKGLKWVQDNVYQVIPEYIDSLQSEHTDNDTSDSSYEDASYQNLDDVVIKNLTTTEDFVPVEDMANDAPDPDANVSINNFANLSGRHQMATTLRETQKQKTENEIKSRILVITGRLNSTGNSNPLQPRHEKLTAFSPTCEIPRNTDPEMWHDVYSMNMQFQLNLTLDQHLVAARLRLFKLPQDNSTATTPTIVDGVENDEKKIRISVYYYIKSLRKHRSKKRLMDSKVASLTGTGEHLALDVKDAAKHWRPSTRHTNHGLLVLVEDQEGRPLQPSNYIQAPNCHNPTESNQQDEKASPRTVPTLFVRACTRYVRVVGTKTTTYQFCQ